MAKKVELVITGKDKASGAIDRVTGRLPSLKTALLGVATAAGSVMAAQKVFSSFVERIKLAGIQEEAEKRLAVALGHTSQALLDQASALQRVTTYGDEAIIEAQALIAAFVGDEEQIKAATRATLDLAAAKGMDLKAAADLVSKTLGSSTNAMSRYGIEVTGAVGSTERLSSLTDNIANKFGGQAAAGAEIFTGKLTQLSNVWGDVKEQSGFAFTKNKELTESIGDLTEQIEVAGPSLTRLAEHAASFAGFMAKGVGLVIQATTGLAQTREGRIAQIRGEMERLQNIIQNTDPEQSGILFKWFGGKSVQGARERLAELREELQGLITATREPVPTDMGDEYEQQELARLRALTEEQRGIHQQNLDMQTLANAVFRAQDLEREAELQENKRLLAQNSVTAAMGLLDNMAVFMGKNNKSLFRMHQALAAAQVLMSTPAAAMDALKNGGGVPWGIPFFVATIAKGAAQLATIKKQKLGGTGSVSAGGGGAAPGAYRPATPTVPAGGISAPQTQAPAPASPAVTIHVHGDLLDADGLVEKIGPILEEHVGDKRITLVPHAA